MDIQVYIMSKRAFLFKMSDSTCMNSPMWESFFKTF